MMAPQTPVMLAANQFLYVVYNGTLYQFNANTLELVNQVSLGAPMRMRRTGLRGITGLPGMYGNRRGPGEMRDGRMGDDRMRGGRMRDDAGMRGRPPRDDARRDRTPPPGGALPGTEQSQ